MTRPLAVASLAAIAWVAVAGAAAAADCQPFLPRPDAGYIVPGTRELVYATPRDSRPLLLDAFAQPDGRVHPAVVVIHGGGWTTGSRIAHVGQLLELLTEAGYQWVSIDYRLTGPERRYEAVDDVRAALDFVACHAGALRIDPSRMVLLGEDVGAELALRAASGSGIRGVAAVGGVYDRRLPAPGVPVRLIHGGADAESPVSAARAYCDGLRASEGVCDLDVVDDAIHRVENWRPAQWIYKPRLVSWLRSVLGRGAERPLTFSPRPLRGPLGAGLHKRIVYQRRSGQTFDAWIPSGAGPHVPVLLVHGGGWEAGDRVTYITPLFRPLAEANVAWFSMDYRLTPDVAHPEQLQDLRDAIAFLREHAGSFDIDADKLVVVGESASAQMATLVGTEDARLAGVISFYGVYDFLPLARNLTARSAVTRLFGITQIDEAARDLLAKYSPIHHVHRAQPPVLLVHGTAEGLWTQGLSMAERLGTAGARFQLIRLEGAPHGMENWEGQPQWLHYKGKVVDWIKAVTGERR